MSNKLDSLIEKYGERDTIKDRKIELKLKYIKELYGECGNSEEMHLFSEIVENFCEILESVQSADQEKIDAIVEAIKADYMVKFNLSSEEALYNYFREVEYDEVCPEGMYKIALGSYVEDGIAYFHFYRQDASGFWSHKNGTIPVTNVDENGSLLPNPLCINDYYGVYGYYMVVPWVSESEMALYDTLENTYEEPLISCSLIKTAVLSFSKQRDE